MEPDAERVRFVMFLKYRPKNHRCRKSAKLSSKGCGGLMHRLLEVRYSSKASLVRLQMASTIPSNQLTFTTCELRPAAERDVSISMLIHISVQ